ncbi:MAG TPA: hypothetical protein VHI13_11215 [Candidatus Kapabacteria bacterium]|nr:hypothetical protein [Candidatus Kapabacteria bacterium]
MIPIVLLMMMHAAAAYATEPPGFIWDMFGGGGGSGNALRAVALDSQHGVFVTGDTMGSDGARHAVVAMLNRYSGSVVWSFAEGGTASCSGYAIAVSNDYLYVAGSNGADATFRGNSGSEAVVIPSAGGFIAKYRVDGTLLWVKEFATSGECAVRKLALDDHAGLYAAGEFTGTLTLPSAKESEPSLSTGTLSNCPFVVRLDADDALIWCTTARVGSTMIGGIAADHGQCYVSGSYGIGGTILTSGGDSASVLNTPAGSSDIFLIRYNDDGSLGFASSLGSTGPDCSGGVAVADGIVYLCGSFAGIWSFECVNGMNISDTSQANSSGAATNDAFVACWDTAGKKFVWFAHSGGPNDDAASSIILKGGMIHVVGWMQSGWFGSGNAVSELFHRSSRGGEDFFVAMYTRNGIRQAVKAGGAGNNDWGRAFAVDDSMQYVVVGTCAAGTQFRNVAGGTGVKWFATKVPTQSDIDVLPDSLRARRFRSKNVALGARVPIRAEIYSGTHRLGVMRDTVSLLLVAGEAGEGNGKVPRWKHHGRNRSASHMLVAVEGGARLLRGRGAAASGYYLRLPALVSGRGQGVHEAAMHERPGVVVVAGRDTLNPGGGGLMEARHEGR